MGNNNESGSERGRGHLSNYGCVEGEGNHHPVRKIIKEQVQR
jgi:hypothetical protein